jgi:predicted AAA+ superfamily ATPase
MGRAATLAQLIQFGGFPEPFLTANERHLRRWQRERLERVIHEDLRDLERVRDISLIDLLVQNLPSCVGSPLSIKSLSRLLQVAHETAATWISMLERLYVCFRIAPYGSPKIRAVRKEQKLYLWDWSHITNDGSRFENLVACQLLKYCHWKEDTEGFSMELRFLRDTDKREVDFVVLRDGRPEFAVECNSGDNTPSSAAHYFRERTSIPLFYQTHRGQKEFGNERSAIRVLPFQRFCEELNLP